MTRGMMRAEINLYLKLLKDQFSENLLPLDLVMNCWIQRSSYSNLTYGRIEKKSREKSFE